MLVVDIWTRSLRHTLREGREMGRSLALRECPPDGVAFLNMCRLEGRLLCYALSFVCAVIADEGGHFFFTFFSLCWSRFFFFFFRN